MTKSIHVKNLGPIPEFEFTTDGPGVTILSAPNGTGKTILHKALQAAARGKGKVPLRDRTRSGIVEAFGATITIGGTCRHSGGFEVTSVEGTCDLAELVDPGIEHPAKADAARVKALISMTGVKASVDLFRKHEAFADFGSVVNPESLETDDMVLMAAKIRKNYYDAALDQEAKAERETGHATALIPDADLNLEDESDAAILQDAYNEARDEQTRLETQAENAATLAASQKAAKELLDSLAADEMTAEKAKLTKSLEDATAEYKANNKTIEELTQKINELNRINQGIISQGKTDREKLASVERQLSKLEEAQATIASASIEPPSPELMTEAAEAVKFASDAIERGTLIRQAVKDSEKLSTHRSAAKLAREKAAKYRDAGKSTDEVLSSCIQCPQLRIESDGKEARLVTDNERGKSIPYHELSDGQKYRIAIDIAAERVGPGGLVTINQVGWEGIDEDNRAEIHEHGIERGIYILALQASRERGAERKIIPEAYKPGPPVVRDEPAIGGFPEIEAPVEEEQKPPAEKPKPKAKSKSKAEQIKEMESKPVIHSDGDFSEYDEDIPF